MKELQFQIALSMLPGIGPIGAKKLIAHCGSASAVFKEKTQNLKKIPGLGEFGIQNIRQQLKEAALLQAAEAEIEFMQQAGIEAHFYQSPSYPQRLVHCEDSPILLYSKGEAELNPKRSLAIIGTRNASIKGRHITEKLVEELSPFNPTIISGLAFGIDKTAHQAALKQNLKTHAVLAHGLDEVKPKAHQKLAEEILATGALLSDYRSKTSILPTNFAERNRLVAGMVDAVIVVESSIKGGSMITAELANGYNRDVFAVPGRIDDSLSSGCNRLIKTNRASLLESAKDIVYLLGWNEEKTGVKVQQRQLFVELNPKEEKLMDCFKIDKVRGIDELSLEAKISMSETAVLLLDLEFKGLVRARPGKMYEGLA